MGIKRVTISFAITFCIIYKSYTKKQLSLDGAVLAFIMGFLLTNISYSLSFALITFFILGSKATSFKKEYKEKFEPSKNSIYKGRNCRQVMANGGVPLILSCLLLQMKLQFLTISRKYVCLIYIAILSSICSCCGDTFASELAPVAQIYGINADPILITSGLQVPKGTNGGVSLPGLIFSALGGFIVSFIFLITAFITNEYQILLETFQFDEKQLEILLIFTYLSIGSLAGLYGSIIDSILGAIFQYTGYDINTHHIISEKPSIIKAGNGTKMSVQKNVKTIVDCCSLLSNDAVNFLTSCLIALLFPTFIKSLTNSTS